MCLFLIISLCISKLQFGVSYNYGYSSFYSDHHPRYGYPNPSEYPYYPIPKVNYGYWDFYNGNRQSNPYGYPGLSEYPMYPNPYILNDQNENPPISSGCGQYSANAHDTIAEGEPSVAGQWPWQVTVYKYSEEDNQWDSDCGGSLINELWFVSAAHCFISEKQPNAVLSPELFDLYFGKHTHREVYDNKYVQRRKVAEIIIHSDFAISNGESDIALVRMDYPVQFNERVQPVCLPSLETTEIHLFPGNKGVITGFGERGDRSQPNVLQQAVVPVISNEDCYAIWGPKNKTITNKMFCAGYLDSKKAPSSCFGDSGGPMVFSDANINEKKWVLEGITSWGPKKCGTPATVYTRVSMYLDWINSIIYSSPQN